jgi:hypothetical protein
LNRSKKKRKGTIQAARKRLCEFAQASVVKVRPLRVFPLAQGAAQQGFDEEVAAILSL